MAGRGQIDLRFASILTKIINVIVTSGNLHRLRRNNRLPVIYVDSNLVNGLIQGKTRSIVDNRS